MCLLSMFSSGCSAAVSLRSNHEATLLTTHGPSDHVWVRVLCVCNLRAKADRSSQQGYEARADVLISITAQHNRLGGACSGVVAGWLAGMRWDERSSTSIK